MNETSDDDGLVFQRDREMRKDIIPPKRDGEPRVTNIHPNYLLFPLLSNTNFCLDRRTRTYLEDSRNMLKENIPSLPAFQPLMIKTV